MINHSRPALRKLAVVLTFAATLTIGALIAYQEASKAGKEVVDSRITSEYQAPPPTIRDMVLASDLVIRGRIVGGKQADHRGGPIQTSYQVSILEILHNYGHKISKETSQVSVLRYGGERETSDKIIRAVEARFPRFHPGSEFIFFLYWHEHEELWAVNWGPAGLIELSHGRPKAWSNIGPLARFEAQSSDDLVRQIKLMIGQEERGPR